MNHIGLSRSGFTLNLSKGGDYPGLRMNRLFLQSPSLDLITGYGHLRKHLTELALSGRICRLCNRQKETAECLLFECPAIATECYAIIGSQDNGGELSQENLIHCL
uniref:Reverse transcriptase zinc-binding domain-containing protein n=1 Tax=Homalodisca liturata TaxID=320908 RepID=A0A1B6HF20_9HEMI